MGLQGISLKRPKENYRIVRGLIQTTFHDNYEAFSREHNKRFPDDQQDFLQNPDFVLSNLQYGVESAFVYWTVTRNINPIADTGDVRAVLPRHSMFARKLLFIFFAIFSANTISFASDAQVKCPAAQIGRNIFKASQISKNSVVAIERKDGDYP